MKTPDMSAPDETFRAMLRVQTLEGEPTTLIVTRQDANRAGHVWLTGNGRIQTTVVLTPQEAEELAGMLWDAASSLGNPVIPAAPPATNAAPAATNAALPASRPWPEPQSGVT